MYCTNRERETVLTRRQINLVVRTIRKNRTYETISVGFECIQTLLTFKMELSNIYILWVRTSKGRPMYKKKREDMNE